MTTASRRRPHSSPIRRRLLLESLENRPLSAADNHTLRHQPKPHPHLLKMCIAREYVRDSKVLHHHKRSEINERNVRLVVVLLAKLPRPRK